MLPERNGKQSHADVKGRSAANIVTVLAPHHTILRRNTVIISYYSSDSFVGQSFPPPTPAIKAGTSDGYVAATAAAASCFPLLGDNGQILSAAVSDASAERAPATAAYSRESFPGDYSVWVAAINPVLPPEDLFPLWAQSRAYKSPPVTVPAYWDIDGTGPAASRLTWDIDKRLSNLASVVSAVKIVGSGTAAVGNWFRPRRIPFLFSVRRVALTEGSRTSAAALVPSSFYGIHAGHRLFGRYGGALRFAGYPVILLLADVWPTWPISAALHPLPELVLTFHSDDNANRGQRTGTRPARGPGIYYAGRQRHGKISVIVPTTPIYVLTGADTTRSCNHGLARAIFVSL
ncbi:hypothetical protein FQR65_LT20057 [Abscondita terminalis]|nr:hypothetical protein FQR65_LT20057 [Abscondita terminalis]